MRTKKVARNLIISTILTMLIALLGLVKTKFFIEYLGAETTGIYQLFNQILSYISLVDAGLTGSLLYSLFEPVSKNDTSKINSILKGGRNFYNKIALIIIILGIIVSLKIDFFISDFSLPLGYIQICFILFIISSAINYFVTSRKIILEARQNIYKVHLVVYSSMLVSGILEIILLSLNFKLLSLMILLIIVSIIQNIIIIIVSNRDYKELNYKSAIPDYTFKKQTKNLLVQKIANIIFNNIDIILISKYIGAGSIVIYTSYMYVVNSLQNIVRKIGSSSLASFGNLLVSEKEKSRDVFYEYNSLCFYIANIICIPLLLVISPFVSIFYGSEYVLSFIGSLFVVSILYLKIIEIPLDVYTSALGYFDKVKKCIIFQSVINLILSFVMLFKFGITGILFATVISYLLGEFLIYPRILNNNYFNNCKINYYKQSIKLGLVSIISFFICFLLTKNVLVNNLFEWFLLGVFVFVINLILVSIYFVVFKEIKFFNRMKELLTKRRKVNEKK